MAVGSCRVGVELVGDFILGFGRYVGLVFEEEDLVVEEGIADDIEIGV